jgi:hypothetical protein
MCAFCPFSTITIILKSSSSMTYISGSDAYVRSKTKVRDAVGPLVNSAGIKESNHEEMCNILNDYFGTVFTEESTVGKLPEVIKKCER